MESSSHAKTFEILWRVGVSYVTMILSISMETSKTRNINHLFDLFNLFVKVLASVKRQHV